VAHLFPVAPPPSPRHPRVGKYGTLENIAVLEEAGVRAYVALHESGSKPGSFPKGDFRYDPERDVYSYPADNLLRPLGKRNGTETAAARLRSTGRGPLSARSASSGPNAPRTRTGDSFVAIRRNAMLSGYGPTAARHSTRRPCERGRCGSSLSSPKLRTGTG
jgi:hypothetical protein